MKDKITAAEYQALCRRKAGNGPKTAKRPPGDKPIARKEKTGQKGPKGPQTDLFVQTCRAELGIVVAREFQFHPIRKWRFDYAIPSRKVALEVEGGAWTGGRHTRAQGFINDMEKYNTAALMGWRVLRVTPEQLLTGSTLSLLRAACS